MLTRIIFFLHRIVRALGNWVLDKRYLNPRMYSNTLLLKYAPFFGGKVLNVSGWDDRDQEGRYYREYFTHCEEYTVSNARIERKGYGSMLGSGVREIEIDLEKPLSTELREKYDVVFNHTTLEHIFNIQLAFKNLCSLSRDAVILVIPVIQQIHVAPSYGDYWRITTMGIAQLFLKYGFIPLVIKTNDQPVNPVYCFAIGVKKSGKYKELIETEINFQMGAALYGSGLKGINIQALLQYDRKNHDDISKVN